MAKDRNYIEEITREAKKSLREKKKQSVSHQIDHMERVWKRARFLSMRIMEEENVVIDMEALQIACYIHDLNESYEGEKADHVGGSMSDGEKLMRKIGYPEHRIKKVLQIVSEHSSENIKAPSSIEAKILYDADKLDGLGALGIARVFALCGQQGLGIDKTVKWYRAKIQKALPYMHTNTGKELARKNLRYVESYLEKIEEEEAELEAT